MHIYYLSRKLNEQGYLVFQDYWEYSDINIPSVFPFSECS